MENIKISVIIPAYNIEGYIGRCLDSILAQTYKNLEIIVVDDGSTDKTPEIIDHYASTDERFVVIHKPNGGLSSARNAGLDIMTGDYVSFVDGDDSIHTDTYVRVVEELNKDKDIDMVSFLFKFESSKDEYRDCNLCNIRDSKDLLKEFIFGVGFISYSLCDKVVKTKFFDDIRFYEGKYYEDGPVALELLFHVKKVAILFREFYFYELNRDSSITYVHNVKVFDAYYILEELKKKYKGDKFICDCIDMTIITHLKHNMLFTALFYNIRGHNKVDKKDEMLKEFCRIARTKAFSHIMLDSFWERLKLRSFVFFPELYAFVYKYRSKKK